MKRSQMPQHLWHRTSEIKASEFKESAGPPACSGPKGMMVCRPVEEAADAARELVLPISTPAGLVGPNMPARSSDTTSAVLAATSSARKQFARQR